MPRRREPCSNRALFVRQQTRQLQRQTFSKATPRYKWPESARVRWTRLHRTPRWCARNAILSMLTSSTKHRLPHLHGLVSPQKERQYGSITCVRIGTIGIPTHRCRAGFWPQLLSLQGKSRSSGKGAGSLSKLLVADGPGPLVRGARDGCPSQSRAQQGSRRTALLSSLLASPQLCSLQGKFQTPGKGAGSLSRPLVAELSPAGFRRATQRSLLAVPSHPPGHNRPPHRPPSSLFAFRFVFGAPSARCPAAQRNKAGPRALD